ncbi:hypothetical protein J6590_088978 [Homalodisca vitripennis]|nr:hypothetical protein J6590_088978 [Homalodisca vitripennis]
MSFSCVLSMSPLSGIEVEVTEKPECGDINKKSPVLNADQAIVILYRTLGPPGFTINLPLA